VYTVSRALVTLVASAACAATLAAPAAPASPSRQALTLEIQRGAKVAIRRVPAGRRLAVAGWKTPFGSVRRLRVVERRGDWFKVESDVLGNGVVGWVPRTAAVRRRLSRFSVEADLSARLLTLRESGRIVFRRRVSIGASVSPTPSGRFHVTDHISGKRWGLGCCIVVVGCLRVGTAAIGSRSTAGRPGRSRSARPRAPAASTRRNRRCARWLPCRSERPS
jgi:hypothetical protein